MLADIPSGKERRRRSAMCRCFESLSGSSVEQVHWERLEVCYKLASYVLWDQRW